MAFTRLASFPNSRIKPRPVTRTAETQQATVGAGGTFTIPANTNRTYLTLFNPSATDTLLYGYNLALIATEGVELIAGAQADLQSPEAVYLYNPNASPLTIEYDEGSG